MSFGTWDALQTALQNWVEAGSGLDDSKVIWANSPGIRPEDTYFTLEIVSIDQLGLDGFRVEDNPGGAPGEEINIITQGVRRMTLSVQCFGGIDPSVYPANLVGDTSPMALVERVLTYARHPTQCQAFKDAGAGFLSWTPVIPVNEVIVEATIEPRAATLVTFALAQEVSIPSTFIGTAQVEGGGDFSGEFDVGAPLSPAAVAGDMSVTLTWDDLELPVTYNLYRSTSSPVTPATGTLIAGVSSGYVDTGLSNGTPYFYVVTAVHPTLGEGQYSTEVTATPTP